MASWAGPASRSRGSGSGCGNFGGVGSAPELFGQGETEEEASRSLDAAWAPGSPSSTRPRSDGGGRASAGSAGGAGSAACWSWSAPRSPSVTGDPDDAGLRVIGSCAEVEGSLERLGVERLDLYLTHEPDPETPIEETLRALDELVRAGKVRAIGASNLDGVEPRGGPRDERAARSRALRLGAERVQPAPTRGEWRSPGLRARGPRVYAVQPACRRLAHRQVPARRVLSGRLADDAASRTVRGAREGRDL